ncbi:MAG: DUF3667 domain-containing protein [Chitinophagaceae bacterium]
MNIVCKNCGRSFHKNYKYCPYCGQTAVVERLNFSEIFHDFFHAFIHTDKGIFLLLKKLTYKPGKIAREYIEGKRKKYFNPFSFLVLMVAVALFFLTQFETLGIKYENVNASNKEILHLSFKYFNLLVFIRCPINAFLLWIFFKKSKINYAEYFVLAAYLSGQEMFFYCIAAILFILFPSAILIIGIVAGILISLWFIIALMQFLQNKSFGNLLKAILILLISQSISQGLVYLFYFVYKQLNKS